jgi:type IV pilus assembly protein PilX
MHPHRPANASLHPGPRCTKGGSVRGVSLVIVLIFVVALSLAAAYGAKQSSMSEKLARNQVDLQTARQAAEAALRDAERDILLPDGSLQTNALCARDDTRPVMDAIWAFDANCTTGQCSLPDTRYASANYATATHDNDLGEPWWPVAKGGMWMGPRKSGNPVLGFSDKPSREGGAVNCDSFSGGVPLGTFTGRPPLLAVSRQPEYLIEYFRRGASHYFRITARGFGYRPETEVVLQTYFRPFG